jgi:ribA/ribD-fused uncharacterized protein
MPEAKAKIMFYSDSGEYGFLSNFYPSQFRINRVVYNSVEHYYQSEKAKSDRLKRWIRDAPSAYYSKVAGRGVREEDKADRWELVRPAVMRKALRAKFVQNEELMRKLLATGDAELHEDSPDDLLWGAKGEDLLGKQLMKLREQLALMQRPT